MINARDLLPMSWIACRMGIQRVISITPGHISPDYPPLQVKWLINGDEEEAYSGIPLTQELLRRNKWMSHRDDEHAAIFRLPGNFYCAFIKKDDGVFHAGDIIVQDEYCPIQFVHELQLQYFAKVGKHLNFDL